MRPYTIFEGMFCSGDLNKVISKRDLIKDAMHDESDKEGGNYCNDHDDDCDDIYIE